MKTTVRTNQAATNWNPTRRRDWEICGRREGDHLSSTVHELNHMTKNTLQSLSLSGESISIDIRCCCVMFHMLLTWLPLMATNATATALTNQSTYINASFRMILTVDECCTYFGRISLAPSLFLWEYVGLNTIITLIIHILCMDLVTRRVDSMEMCKRVLSVYV